MQKKYSILCSLILLFFNQKTIAQWQKMTIETDASFRSIHAVNAKIVWAGGSKGTILRTIDGGKNWRIVHPEKSETLDFRDIYGVNAQTAFAMSAGEAEKGNAKILQTNDGGMTWKIIFETQEKGVFFDSMDFWNAQEGLVFSDPINGKLLIIKTLDGGKTWNRISTEKLSAMNTGEASFAASGNSLVVKGKNKAWISTQNRVFYSSDKGENWQVAETPFVAGQTSGIFGLHFYSAKDGFAVGGDYKNEKLASKNIAITHDGGKTWSLATPTQPEGLKEAAFWVNKKLLVVGPSGTGISSDLGSTWTAYDSEKFHTMSCFGSTCYAIGSKGNLGKLLVK